MIGRSQRPSYQVENIHAQIRQEIAEYKEKKREKDDRGREATQKLLNIELQDLTVKEVTYGCSRIDRLLLQLEDDAQVEEAKETEEDPTAQQAKEKTTEEDNISAVRAFAADDATMETTSVSDYASEPPAPPVFSDECLHDCVEMLQDSTAKWEQSAATLRELVDDNPQWWNSAIVVRRLKTHTVRLNYHARKVKKWSDHGRAQLFVSSSVLNRTARDATKEMQEMKVVFENVEARRKVVQDASPGIHHEHDTLKEHLEALQEEKEKIDAELMEAASTRCDFQGGDVTVCEALLLLQKVSSLPEASNSSQVLKKWLSKQKTLINKSS